MSAPFDVESMSAEDRMKLGAIVREARIAQDMTALTLATVSGVDRKTIRTIESGERAGQPRKLMALLEALSIPQVSDYDKFTERTRAFILTAAPIFEQIPDGMKDDAHNDVIVLLGGKLKRAGENVTPIRPNVPARGHDQGIAASDDDNWQKRQEDDNE